jgi:hypothetical protein
MDFKRCQETHCSPSARGEDNSAIPELFKLNYPHPVHKTKFHTSSITKE